MTVIVLSGQQSAALKYNLQERDGWYGVENDSLLRVRRELQTSRHLAQNDRVRARQATIDRQSNTIHLRRGGVASQRMIWRACGKASVAHIG